MKLDEYVREDAYRWGVLNGMGKTVWKDMGCMKEEAGGDFYEAFGRL